MCSYKNCLLSFFPSFYLCFSAFIEYLLLYIYRAFLVFFSPLILFRSYIKKIFCTDFSVLLYCKILILLKKEKYVKGKKCKANNFSKYFYKLIFQFNASDKNILPRNFGNMIFSRFIKSDANSLM